MPVLKGILGRKLGMTQIFTEDGRALAVTVLQAGPCVVTQQRTLQQDGYQSVQLGFGDVKPKHVNKPLAGHFKRAGIEPKRTLVEFRIADLTGWEVGKEIKADLFQAGEVVSVTGTSKGKGFAGVMKRHGFHGAGASHGSMLHRKPASGGATDAARVFPGTKKPGHMGAVRTTIKGLKVLRVDAERNLIVIQGAVPGAPRGLIRITTPVTHPRKSGKVKVVT